MTREYANHRVLFVFIKNTHESAYLLFGNYVLGQGRKSHQRAKLNQKTKNCIINKKSGQQKRSYKIVR